MFYYQPIHHYHRAPVGLLHKMPEDLPSPEWGKIIYLLLRQEMGNPALTGGAVLFYLATVVAVAWVSRAGKWTHPLDHYAEPTKLCR